MASNRFRNEIFEMEVVVNTILGVINFCMFVFSSSAMAFDLGGALKQVQQMAIEQQQKADQRQPVQSNQQTSTSAPQEKPSSTENSQSGIAQPVKQPTRTSSPVTSNLKFDQAGYCNLVQSDPSVRRYVDLMEKAATAIGEYDDEQRTLERAKLDSPGGELLNWVSDRFKEINDDDRNVIFETSSGR